MAPVDAWRKLHLAVGSDGFIVASRLTDSGVDDASVAGAHEQARAENGMYRYKRIIGDALRPRKPAGQKWEALVAVNVLNRMTRLGMPESVAVAA